MSTEAPGEVSKVLSSGYIGQGPKVEELESQLKQIFNNEFVITCNSATSAEHLSWQLLKKPEKDWPGITEDDEILTCPLSCFATFSPILLNNFKIRWVDVDPTTMNIDLDDLERKITRKTKAIQIVLWGGYSVDFDRVKRIQEKTKDLYGFKPAVLVDCAHAFGTTYKGKQISELGNICTYSFQAIKHLNGIDAGALVLPYQELYKRGDLLKWYGLSRRIESLDFRCGVQDIEEAGTKWHLNDVCATTLLSNLPYRDQIINKHKENAAFYDKELQHTDGVTQLSRSVDCESSFWIYSMLVADRTNFIKAMKDRGVQTSQVHERCDKYACVKEFKSHLPALDSVIGDLVNIPVGWWVEKEDLEYIVSKIREGW